MLEKHKQWFILGGLMAGFLIGYIIGALLPGNNNSTFMNFILMAAGALVVFFVTQFFKWAKRSQ